MTACLKRLFCFRRAFWESLTGRGVLKERGGFVRLRGTVLFVREAAEVKMLLVDSRRSDTDDLDGEESQSSCILER